MGNRTTHPGSESLNVLGGPCPCKNIGQQHLQEPVGLPRPRYPQDAAAVPRRHIIAAGSEAVAHMQRLRRVSLPMHVILVGLICGAHMQRLRRPPRRR